MLDKRKFYIDGQWVDPLKPNDLAVINPATEKPVAVITMGTAADIDRAVSAAKRVADAVRREADGGRWLAAAATAQDGRDGSAGLRPRAAPGH